MPWNEPDDGATVVFECDSCDETVTCNVAKVRVTASTAEPETSNFAMCWRYMQGLGWRSFKRTGHPWTFHCVKCGPQAEVEHNENKRREIERGRLRVRNARD